MHEVFVLPVAVDAFGDGVEWDDAELGWGVWCCFFPECAVVGLVFVLNAERWQAGTISQVGEQDYFLLTAPAGTNQLNLSLVTKLSLL